jgi:hypothetical protein
MKRYQDCLTRIRQSVKEVVMPPLGLLPLMLNERKKQRDKELQQFEKLQAQEAQLGTDAMTRLFMRHEGVLSTHHSNYVDAIDHHQGDKS